MTKQLIVWSAGFLMITGGLAHAQNNPSTDWNGSHQFRTPQQISVRLLEAEMIERKRSDYYDEFGRTNVNVTTNVNGNLTNDYSRNITNHFPDGFNAPVDQSERSTTAVGAINSTTIDISNGSNINIESRADSVGCQDGGIRIGTPGQVGGMAASC